jgi:hypothetical protein
MSLPLTVIAPCSRTGSTDDLGRLAASAEQLVPGESALVQERIQALLAALEGAKKSRRWRMRGKLGRRAPWYVLPEEV